MELFRMFGTVLIETTQARRDLTDVTAEAESASSRLANIGAKMVGVGTALSAAVSAPIAGVIAAGVTYNATMQDLNTSFKVMLGSEEAAKKMSEDLIKMGAETPFESTQLADYTKMLLSFGYTADNVLPIMSRLGDISLGNAEKMSSLTRTMGQINSLGKLQGGDLNQLIGQGWNPLNEITKKTGETMEQVRKRMEDGKITYKEVEDALIASTSAGGQFYNGMAEGAKTFNGQMSTLSDTISMFLGNLTKPLFDALAEGLPTLIALLGSLSTMFAGLDPNMQLLILGLGLAAAAVGPLLVVAGILVTSIGALIPVITAVSAVIAGISAPVWIAIAAVVALSGVAAVLIAAFFSIRDSIANIFGALYAKYKTEIDMISAMMQNAWAGIKTVTEQVWGAIQVSLRNIWAGIKLIFELAWTGIQMWFDVAMRLFEGDFTGAWARIKQGVSDSWALIKNNIVTAWANIQSWWTTAGPIFESAIKATWQAITTNIPMAWALIKESISTAWSIMVAWMQSEGKSNFRIAIEQVWTDILTYAPVAWETIKAALQNAWASICEWYNTGGKEQIITVLYAINSAIGTALGAVWDGIKAAAITAITALNDAIGFAFKALAAEVVQYGRDVMQGFVNGINDRVSSATAAIASVASNVTNKFKSVLGIQSPSRVFLKLGVDVVEGLTNGFTQEEATAVSAMDRLSNGVVKALENRLTKKFTILEKAYKKESEEVEKTYKKEKDAAQNASDHTIKLINKNLKAKLKALDLETDASVKGIQGQIDAIDAVTEAEDARASELEFVEKKKEYTDELADVTKQEKDYMDKKRWLDLFAAQHVDSKTSVIKDQVELDKALSDLAEKKRDAQKQLELLEQEHNRAFVLSQREAEKEALARQIEKIQEQAALRKETLEAQAAEELAQNEASLEQNMLYLETKNEQQKIADANRLELLRETYKAETQAQVLQAQAAKLIYEGQQEDLIALLEAYYPEWETAGRSFGEQLVDGLESKRSEIESTVSALVQLANKGMSLEIMRGSAPAYAEGTNYVPETGMALLHKGEAVIPAKYNQPFGAGAAANVINNVHINNPVVTDNRFADQLGGMIVGRLKTLGVT